MQRDLLPFQRLGRSVRVPQPGRCAPFDRDLHGQPAEGLPGHRREPDPPALLMLVCQGLRILLSAMPSAVHRFCNCLYRSRRLGQRAAILSSTRRAHGGRATPPTCSSTAPSTSRRPRRRRPGSRHAAAMATSALGIHSRVLTGAVLGSSTSMRQRRSDSGGGGGGVCLDTHTQCLFEPRHHSQAGGTTRRGRRRIDTVHHPLTSRWVVIEHVNAAVVLWHFVDACQPDPSH